MLNFGLKVIVQRDQRNPANVGRAGVITARQEHWQESATVPTLYLVQDRKETNPQTVFYGWYYEPDLALQPPVKP